jgi:dUTPase
LGRIVMELEEKVDNIKKSLENKLETKVETPKVKDVQAEEEKEEIVVSIKISSETQNYSIKENDIIVYNQLNDIYVHSNETIEISTGIYLEIPPNYQIQASIIFDKRNIYGTCILSDKNEIIVILNNYHTVDHYELTKGSAIAEVSVVKKANINWIE